jgi:hypothetical protein
MAGEPQPTVDEICQGIRSVSTLIMLYGDAYLPFVHFLESALWRILKDSSARQRAAKIVESGNVDLSFYATDFSPHPDYKVDENGRIKK